MALTKKIDPVYFFPMPVPPCHNSLPPLLGYFPVFSSFEYRTKYDWYYYYKNYCTTKEECNTKGWFHQGFIVILLSWAALSSFHPWFTPRAVAREAGGASCVALLWAVIFGAVRSVGVVPTSIHPTSSCCEAGMGIGWRSCWVIAGWLVITGRAGWGWVDVSCLVGAVSLYQWRGTKRAFCWCVPDECPLLWVSHCPSLIF